MPIDRDAGGRSANPFETGARAARRAQARACARTGLPLTEAAIMLALVALEIAIALAVAAACLRLALPFQ